MNKREWNSADEAVVKVTNWATECVGTNNLVADRVLKSLTGHNCACDTCNGSKVFARSLEPSSTRDARGVDFA